VAAGAAFMLRDRWDLAAVEAAIGGLGPWGPIAFVALFAAGTVLFLPGSVFGLAGGALFGPLWSTVLNLAGGTLGAILAFLVARHIAADWMARRAGGRLRQVVEGVEAEGWHFVALIRLVPVVPFMGGVLAVAMPAAVMAQSRRNTCTRRPKPHRHRSPRVRSTPARCTRRSASKAQAVARSAAWRWSRWR
jgi:uncharacterized membrane protein YdjX (TVP38/TMEM64 family)